MCSNINIQVYVCVCKYTYIISKQKNEQKLGIVHAHITFFF